MLIQFMLRFTFSSVITYSLKNTDQTISSLIVSLQFIKHKICIRKIIPCDSTELKIKTKQL